jgi:hypothetical protein
MSPRRAPQIVLAFGQADQAVFRETKGEIGWLQVPGTIATYFREATGGFVLSLECPYVLDPRTPMLQFGIPATEVRASHKSLAAEYGAEFLKRVEANSGPPTDDEWVDGSKAIAMFQRDYVTTSAAKVAKYAKLLGKPATTPSQAKFILPAYLMVDGHDARWALSVAMLEAARGVVPDRPFAAVAALRSANGQFPDFAAMRLMLADLAAQHVEDAFMWLNDFDDREAAPEVLAQLQIALSEAAVPRLYNMYGSFISSAIGGFAAVASGVGYSEKRAADVLYKTGAAPARYYHPHLHSFMNQEVAALFAEAAGGALACKCAVCANTTPGELSSLSHANLLIHFVHARVGERDLATQSRSDIATVLDEAAGAAAAAVKKLPGRLAAQVHYDHLARWSTALRMLS